MEFGHTHLLIMFTVICVVSSNIQNSELTDKIDELEIIVFGKNLCQNCMVKLQVKYLELVLKKTQYANLLIGQVILHSVWLVQSQTLDSMWLWLCLEFGTQIR